MIVSYLARLILLLPEISVADANRLSQIASTQQAHVGRSRSDRLASRPQAGAYLGEERVDYDNRQWDQHERNGVGYVDRSDCIPINETLRKNLIQVRFAEA